MRILYCNKYDYPFSGTESYLFDLIHKMDERGHRTALFSMRHGQPGAFSGLSYRVPYIDFKDPSAGLLKKARMAVHALYSPSSRRSMGECIAEFLPEVAHVRGIYHHLSPSILWELRRSGVPVLYHLNDFKILCPTYNFVADGRPCERCKGGAFHNVATRGCYSGTRTSAVVLAAEAYLNKWLRTYDRCVDLFLAPSEFVRDKLVESGFPAQRIEVLRHFQDLPTGERDIAPEDYILYFGRLSAEKGVGDLLRAMIRLPHVPLVVAGDGPERRRLEASAKDLNLKRVSFTGTLLGERLHELIAKCKFSIFPSHAYETLGKSILESYARARPVVASDAGSRRELVEHGVTGLLYNSGDDGQLARCIGFLYERPDLAERMGEAARRRIRAEHDPEKHINQLLDLYSKIARAKRGPSSSSARQDPPRKVVRAAFIGGRGVVNQYSGVESFYEHAGHELSRRGHQITVYCRSYFTPGLRWHEGMRVRRLPTVRSKHLETFIHTLLSTVHAMSSDFDVIHYQCLGPALFSFLPRLVGKKTVVTVQGLDWQRGKWGRLAARVLRCGDAAAVVFPNATMVVSRTLQRYYRENFGCETVYIPNGAVVREDRTGDTLTGDALRRRNLTANNYVLFLGRFSPEKNCLLLIQAFENLQTDMKLVLAGGSSHSDAYVEELRRHESERIRFLPWTSGKDLQELLCNAAVFVLPSEIEGMSLALLDAMAAGVCALASDIPENREVLGGAGYTFRRGDEADLRRRLQLLISSPQLRVVAGRRERERVGSQYLWPEIARSIEKTYHDVLGWSATDCLENKDVADEAAEKIMGDGSQVTADEELHIT